MLSLISLTVGVLNRKDHLRNFIWSFILFTNFDDAIAAMSWMEGQKDIYKEAKEKFWQTFWVSRNLISAFWLLFIFFGKMWTNFDGILCGFCVVGRFWRSFGHFKQEMLGQGIATFLRHKNLRARPVDINFMIFGELASQLLSQLGLSRL